MAELIDRVGDVPLRVWPPLANGGRALGHQGVLLVSQAVFDRIARTANHAERAAVLRSACYIDTGGLEDEDPVPLWPPPGRTPGSNGPAGRGRGEKAPHRPGRPALAPGRGLW